MPVSCVSFQKHLGVYLVEKLNVSYYIKKKISKAMKGIGVMEKLSNMLSWNSLIKIYKAFVRPNNPVGLKFLITLSLGVSHLNEHNKFKHNFKDCVIPLYWWWCSLKTESPSHFFLHCHCFTNISSTLMDDLKSIDV